MILLPTVILNSAWWGQADSIYTAFILISIVYLLKKRYFLSFVFLGISFSFKLQFIFILPLYILVYLSTKEFSIWNFFIIPIMNINMCLPAILCGKSAKSCLSVYINQTKEYSQYISMNFPGLWSIFGTNSENSINLLHLKDNSYGNIGIIIMMCIYAILAFIVIYKKIKFDNQKIVEFGLLSIMIATFFLPHMHDRYLYVGDILSILYVIYNKDKWYVPVGVSIVSLYCYIAYLCKIVIIPIRYVSIFYFIVIAVVAKDIYFKHIHNEESKNVLKNKKLLKN